MKYPRIPGDENLLIECNNKVGKGKLKIWQMLAKLRNLRWLEMGKENQWMQGSNLRRSH